MTRAETPLLDQVPEPSALRELPRSQLRQLADELREETISAVSVTGGHLGAGLGVVELTVALHYVFDTPRDRLIWDVGHQAYPHKILTGRRDRIRTLRMSGGLSGLSHYLARLVSSGKYLTLRSIAQKLARKLPRRLHVMARRWEEYSRGFWTGGTLFEELGFYYVGPVDGHNVERLVKILENVRDAAEGPMLVHVVTKKGKGYAPAEAAADKYHGVVKFDVVTGKQDKGAGGGPPAYQNVFGETLASLAQSDPKICAITAAMPSGTGVDRFAQAHPARAFDVGIAEQHAVTFAAGL